MTGNPPGSVGGRPGCALLLAWLALAPASSFAQPADAVEIDRLFPVPVRGAAPSSAETLVRAAFANLFDIDAAMQVESALRRASGELERSRFRLYRKQFDGGERRVLIAMQGARAGAVMRVLEIERDAEIRSWIYAPRVDAEPIQSAFRLTDPFLGAVSDQKPGAVRADLGELVRAHEIVSRESALLDGEPVYRIGLRPLAASRLSERVELFIARDAPVILEYRYFEGGDPEAARTATVPRTQLQSFQGHLLPGRMLYRDRLQGTQTELILSYEVLPGDPAMQRQAFRESSFHRARIPGLD